MSIPTPKDLIAKMKYARSVEGVAERIGRVMNERPDLGLYTFDVPIPVSIIILNLLRDKGWNARYASRSHYIASEGVTKIEVIWPETVADAE